MSLARVALLLASLAVAACGDDELPCHPSFQQVDATRSCLLPLLAQPCYEAVGPPAVVCSVATDGKATDGKATDGKATDGKVYVSRDGRQYPGARPCTSDETAKYLAITDCK